MPYTVKRPSETRHRTGRRPAPTPTKATREKANPGLGPVMGQFFGITRGKPTKAAADKAAKEAPTKPKK